MGGAESAGPPEGHVLKSLKLATVLVFAASVMAGCDGSTNTVAANGTSSTSSNPSAPTGNGMATLIWQTPTTDTSGAALTDLAGYRIYYGMSATDLSQTVQLSIGIQTYVIDALGPGTWYFAIKAVTSTGAESALSNVASKTIG